MKDLPLPSHLAAIPLAALCMLNPVVRAAPLQLSQSPPATVKEPPPNVVVTLDDSSSMGAAGMAAIRAAMAAAFSQDVIPDGSIRVAWQSLNSCQNLPLTATASSGCGVYNGMRLIDKAHRANLLS